MTARNFLTAPSPLPWLAASPRLAFSFLPRRVGLIRRSYFFGLLSSPLHCRALPVWGKKKAMTKHCTDAPSSFQRITSFSSCHHLHGFSKQCVTDSVFTASFLLFSPSLCLSLPNSTWTYTHVRGPMFCCRILCFVLLLLSTAAAACACFFPLLQRETVVAAAGDGASAGTSDEATVDLKHSLRLYAWYTQQKSNADFYEQFYTRDLRCSRAKLMFMATAVSTAVAIVFGFVGTFVATGSLSYREKRRCPCCSTFVFSLLGFAFLAVPVALTVTLFMTSSCASSSLEGTAVAACVPEANCSYDSVTRFLLYESSAKSTVVPATSQQFPSLKSLGFPIGGPGFCCLCGAAGGMLLSMLLSIGA